MNNTSVKHKHDAVLSIRLKQIAYISMFISLVATIIVLFLQYSNDIILSIALHALAMASLLLFIKLKRVELAKQVYVWSSLIIVSYIFWADGGIFSPGLILLYPIYLTVSALICSSRVFFLAYFFIISQVILLGLYAIHSKNTTAMVTFDYWQMALVILLVSVSGHTAWRFNGDMKNALKKLSLEVYNVKKSRSVIESLIHFDPLTGLSSRLDSKEKYTQLISNFSQKEEDIFFLFLDIDNFKSVNDYYNHNTGDVLLKKVAKRLLKMIRENEVACRLSGDEFLLIINKPNNYNIKKFTQKILKKISKPVEILGNTVEITVSIGVALVDDQSHEDFESVLKKADLAMYHAKQSGKNKCYFYDNKLMLQALRKKRIVSGLTAALKNDNFDLFLQPKVDITTGRIKSAEALIRWSRGNPENVSPGEFILLIESTELIRSIGDWVIGEACRLGKEIYDHGFKEIPISVNISATQFSRGGLEKSIIEQLQLSNLPPNLLELELTEHIVFKNDDDVINELNRIRDSGVNLSIDDFGTGYSNLGYLTRLKVDYLKIDQSFIKDIDKSSQSLVIVDAMIKMSKALGLKIIAEGVESEAVWKVLEDLDCDYGQGFIWSKPLPAKDFLSLLESSV